MHLSRFQTIWRRIASFAGGFNELNPATASVPADTVVALSDLVRRYRSSRRIPAELLSEGVAQLSPECRDVLLHRKVAHWSHAEIAVRAGLSVESVERLHALALQSLRRWCRPAPLELKEEEVAPRDSGLATGLANPPKILPAATANGS